MDLGIKDKHALITGGSHGIGLAIAHVLAEEGCRISITSRIEKHLKEASNNLRNYGNDVFLVTGNVLSKTDQDRIYDSCENSLGPIDILINNVGGGGRWGNIDYINNFDEEFWNDVYMKNVVAARRFTQKCLSGMIKNQWGRIITISSIHGREGGGRPAFAMAKSAEIALMKAFSKDHYLVRHGITFNSVAPGRIYIENSESDYNMILKYDLEKLPLGKFGTPVDVANIVGFLSSNLASYINGSCIVIDGGESYAL